MYIYASGDRLTRTLASETVNKDPTNFIFHFEYFQNGDWIADQLKAVNIITLYKGIVCPPI